MFSSRFVPSMVPGVEKSFQRGRREEEEKESGEGIGGGRGVDHCEEALLATGCSDHRAHHCANTIILQYHPAHQRR